MRKNKPPNNLPDRIYIQTELTAPGLVKNLMSVFKTDRSVTGDRDDVSIFLMCIVPKSN
jgi:hypothetical protein